MPSSATSGGKLIHAVLDNYATTSIQGIGLAVAHPRWTFHFTTSASWLNAVENFFSKMTATYPSRCLFSIAISRPHQRLSGEHNASKLFVWTNHDAILAKLTAFV